MWQKNWPILFVALVLSNACAHHPGPDVQVCIVDVQNHGFQCANETSSVFLPFEKGEALQCVSPIVLEGFIKDCKAGAKVEEKDLEICSLQYSESRFACLNPQSLETFYVALADSDNYFCLSHQDLKRVLERCKAGDHPQ